MILLALFGSLLFLLIFEGGKGRYMMQFFPLVLIMTGVGWNNVICKMCKSSIQEEMSDTIEPESVKEQ